MPDASPFPHKKRATHWEDGVDMDAPAPPYDYNPSAWSQRIPICILATVGALIAAYMSLFQFGLIDNVWDPVFGDGTEKVLKSETAKKMDRWLHIPDAAFGAWGYLSEAVFGLVGSTRRWHDRPWMVILFGIDVIPLGGVSALLVVAQGFIVGAWCFPCLLTATISFILVYLAYDEVWACMKYLYRVKKKSGSWKVLWDTFWAKPSRLAHEVATVGKV